MRLRFGKY